MTTREDAVAGYGCGMEGTSGGGGLQWSPGHFDQEHGWMYTNWAVTPPSPECLYGDVDDQPR